MLEVNLNFSLPFMQSLKKNEIVAKFDMCSNFNKTFLWEKSHGIAGRVVTPLSMVQNSSIDFN